MKNEVVLPYISTHGSTEAILIPSLHVDVLGTVLQKGCPTADTFGQLEALAGAVSEAHQKDDLISLR